VLKIQEHQEVEETVAANTLGTIVHDALEELYTPFVSKVLSVAALESIYPKISAEITAQFIKSFKGGDFSKVKTYSFLKLQKSMCPILLILKSKR